MRLWSAEGGWARIPYCRLDDITQPQILAENLDDQGVRCEILVDLEEDHYLDKLRLQDTSTAATCYNEIEELNDKFPPNIAKPAVPYNGSVTTFEPIHRLSFFKGPRSRIKYILDVSITNFGGWWILG